MAVEGLAMLHHATLWSSLWLNLAINSNRTENGSGNITEATLYGQWNITIKSEGSFTVQVLGYSELIISTQIFTTGPNGGEGIGDQKPLESTNSWTSLNEPIELRKP